MPDIVIATLNAQFIHASLGLRYLLANLNELRKRTALREFVIDQRPIDIAESVLALNPRVVGFGVYIWNVTQTTEVVAILKAVRPDIRVIVGGPEVSYETEPQRIAQIADFVITGQADLAFRELCAQLLAGSAPDRRILRPERPALPQLRSPYPYYSDEDIARRLLYVEASRGCPFKCEFCLSSLDKTAWPFEIDGFLADMDALHKRGARHFKFVDRTFNLNIKVSHRILNFFLERMTSDLFLHFEMIPDHLPDALKETIARFPEGSLQFEIGIQSFDPAVQSHISRRQDNAASADNIRWLRRHSHAHLHTDLIVGLPGETVESFARGFDALVALDPHEIQVGILKRLRGTPIVRHTDVFGMRYNPNPPYNILANDRIDFATMQRLARFARYWDMIGNSGRFVRIRALLLGDAPFARFMRLSDWLYSTTGQTHRIALDRLFELVYDFAVNGLAIPEPAAREALSVDYRNSGARGNPSFLTPDAPRGNPPNVVGLPSTTRRQHRHRRQSPP
jgi:radical SAM superfamily enzyme YgiQ (UPF0313 family)